MTTHEDRGGLGDFASVEEIQPKPTERAGNPGEVAAEGPASVWLEALRANTWAAMGDELAARVVARHDGSEKPISSPWPTLDRTMGRGVWSGVHFLVGGTGSGKSQFAIQVGIHAARNGTPVLYLALELDELGLFARGASFLCGHTKDTVDTTWSSVKWSEFYTGEVKGVPSDVVNALKTLPFHWIVAPPHGWRYDGLVEAVAALRTLYPEHIGPVMIVVDFLQLVASANEREELRERIGRAAYAARHVARAADAVVLVLSSTSREGYGKAVVKVGAPKGRGGKDSDDSGVSSPQFPALGELVGLGKESGEVEYAADSVLVLCPETYTDEDDKPRGPSRVHLAVAKLRAGSPGWVPLTFDGSRFTDVEATEAPSKAVPVNVRGAGKNRGPSKQTTKWKDSGPSDGWNPPFKSDPEGGTQ